MPPSALEAVTISVARGDARNRERTEREWRRAAGGGAAVVGGGARWRRREAKNPRRERRWREGALKMGVVGERLFGRRGGRALASEGEGF